MVQVMTSRRVIVVDIETTGLDVDTCWPLEISAVDVASGEAINFVPFITRSALGNAEFEAMQVNRYYERGAWRFMSDETMTKACYAELRDMLTGNTLAGSNPRFDAAVLRRFIGEVWHHRLGDLAVYAAPVMGLGLDSLPGLHTVCEFLGVENSDPHSASGDAEAMARCFRELMKRYARTWADIHSSPADSIPPVVEL